MDSLNLRNTSKTIQQELTGQQIQAAFLKHPIAQSVRNGVGIQQNPVLDEEEPDQVALDDIMKLEPPRFKNQQSAQAGFVRPRSNQRKQIMSQAQKSIELPDTQQSGGSSMQVTAPNNVDRSESKILFENQQQ